MTQGVPKMTRSQRNPRDQSDGHGIMPPTYFFFTLIVSIALHFIYPTGRVFDFPYIGLALTVFGVVLNLWTDRLFKEGETTVKPFEDPSLLITSGPFSISRHPMYLGMASILLGVAFIMGTVISFVFPMLFVVAMELLFISHEEEDLERIFGEKYREYRRRVRRWV